MARSTIFRVKNVTGEAIPARRAVYITGFDDTDQVSTVALASYNDEAKMPAVGVTTEEVADGDVANIRVTGLIGGFDTAAFEPNTSVYVGANGELIFEDPLTIDSDFLSQQVGSVAKTAFSPTGQIFLHPLEVFTAESSGEQLSHSQLADLTDDAHPQYILVDGTRGFTGAVPGITPFIPQHLATKGYVDDEIESATGGIGPQDIAIVPHYISTTLLTTSSSSSLEYNIFDEDNHSSFVQDTNWKHLITPNGISFDKSNGRFSIGEDGYYHITSTINIEQSSSESSVDMIIRKNSTTDINITNNGVRAAGYPQEFTLSIIAELVSGDFIELLVDGTNAVSVHDGTTLSIYRVDYPTTNSASVTHSSGSRTRTEGFTSSSSFSLFEGHFGGSPLATPNSTEVNAQFSAADGTWTVGSAGIYKVYVTNSIFGNGTSGAVDGFTIEKNSTEVYSQEPYVVDSTSGNGQYEYTMALILELSDNGVINALADGPGFGVLSANKGSSFNVSRIDQILSGGTGTINSNAYVSTTLLTDSDGIGGITPFNIFDEDNHSFFTENINWQHNVTPKNITFNQTTGEFIATNAGIYVIDVVYIIDTNSVGTVNLEIRNNGAAIQSFNTEAHGASGAIDPVERTQSFIVNLEAGDAITVLIASSGIAQADAGTTFNMHRIDVDIEDFLPGNNLGDLDDVIISSPTNGQVVTYNSSSSIWENVTLSIPSELSDLDDVDTSGVADAQVLTYNSGTSQWEPADPSGGSVTSPITPPPTFSDSNYMHVSSLINATSITASSVLFTSSTGFGFDRLSSSDISFSASTGRATIGSADAAGTYMIDVNLFLKYTTLNLTPVDEFSIRKNGSAVWTSTPTIDNNPTLHEVSGQVMLDLANGDYIDIIVDPASTMEMVADSTFTMWKVDTDIIADAGPLNLIDTGRISRTIISDIDFQSAEFDVFSVGTSSDNCTATNITFTESDGRFTVNKSGVYKIDLTFMINNNTDTMSGDEGIFINKNGSTIHTWQQTVFSGGTFEATETSTSIIVQLDVDDYINIRYFFAPSRVGEGTTLTITRVDHKITGGLSTIYDGYGSITLLSDTNVESSEFNPFDSGSHSSFVEDSDWQRNINDQGVSFNPSTGSFTVSRDGIYGVDINWLLEGTGSGGFNWELQINGSQTYSFNPLPIIITTGSAIEYSHTSILDLSAGDSVQYTISPLSSMAAKAGSTFNINRIDFEAENFFSGLLLNDLVDVSAGSPSVDDVLSFNGDEWVPKALNITGGTPIFDENARVSVTLLTDMNLLTGERNPFQPSNHSSFTEDTNWQHNCAAKNLDFNSFGVGRVFVNQSGTYLLSVSVYFDQTLSNSASTQGTMRIRKNGTTIVTDSNFGVAITGSTGTEPENINFTVVIDALDGNDLQVTFEPNGGSWAAVAGTTINMFKIDKNIVSGGDNVIFSTNDHISTSLNNDGSATSSQFTGFVTSDVTTHTFLNISHNTSTGAFTVDKDGIYKIELDGLVQGTSGGFSMDPYELRINGTQEWTAFDTRHGFLTRANPINIIRELDAGDELTWVMDGVSLRETQGNTMNIYRVAFDLDNAAVNTLSNQYLSLTQLSTAGSTTSSDFNPFDEAHHFSDFDEDDEWEYNVTPSGITFDETGGVFTVEETGTYYVDATIYFANSLSIGANTQWDYFRLEKNGSTVWTSAPAMHASYDPRPFSCKVILDLNAGDELEVHADATSVRAFRGSTFTIHRVDYSIQELVSGGLSDPDRIGVNHLNTGSGTVIPWSHLFSTANAFDDDIHYTDGEGIGWEYTAEPVGITWDTSTGEFTIATTGTYQISWNFTLWHSNASFPRYIGRIKVNNTTVALRAADSDSTNFFIPLSFDLLIDLNAGDVIEFEGSGNTGGGSYMRFAYEMHMQILQIK